MPARKERSRTMRRVFRKTPGGRVSLQYKRRKPNASKCGSCGDSLKGTLRELPYKMKNVPKTTKRPERPYGGVLCSKCMRSTIVASARQ